MATLKEIFMTSTGSQNDRFYSQNEKRNNNKMRGNGNSNNNKSENKNIAFETSKFTSFFSLAAWKAIKDKFSKQRIETMLFLGFLRLTVNIRNMV